MTQLFLPIVVQKAQGALVEIAKLPPVTMQRSKKTHVGNNNDQFAKDSPDTLFIHLLLFWFPCAAWEPILDALHPVQGISALGLLRAVDAAHLTLHSHAAHGNEGTPAMIF